MELATLALIAALALAVLNLSFDRADSRLPSSARVTWHETTPEVGENGWAALRHVDTQETRTRDEMSSRHVANRGRDSRDLGHKEPTAAGLWTFHVRLTGPWLTDEYSLHVLNWEPGQPGVQLPLMRDHADDSTGSPYQDYTAECKCSSTGLICRDRGLMRFQVVAAHQGAVCPIKEVVPTVALTVGETEVGGSARVTVEAPVTCDLIAVNCDGDPLEGLEIEIGSASPSAGWMVFHRGGSLARVQRESGMRERYKLYAHSLQRAEGVIDFGFQDRVVPLTIEAPCVVIIETRAPAQLSERTLASFQIAGRKEGPYFDIEPRLVQEGVLIEPPGRCPCEFWIRYRAPDGRILGYEARPIAGEVHVATRSD